MSCASEIFAIDGVRGFDGWQPLEESFENWGTDVRLQAVKTTSKCYLGYRQPNTAKVDNKSLGMVGREFLTTTMSVNTYI
jgi:hypothetical protein